MEEGEEEEEEEEEVEEEEVEEKEEEEGGALEFDCLTELGASVDSEACTLLFSSSCNFNAKA